MFKLDDRLQKDTCRVGDLALSTLLMHRDSNYPWFILVPMREAMREVHHLSEADQQVLLLESSVVAKAITAVFSPDKLNIAMLGNIVEQLHIHHVARFKGDVSWPGPIWGAAPARQYQDELLEQRVALMRQALLSEIVI